MQARVFIYGTSIFAPTSVDGNAVAERTGDITEASAGSWTRDELVIRTIVLRWSEVDNADIVRSQIIF